MLIATKKIQKIQRRLYWTGLLIALVIVIIAFSIFAYNGRMPKNFTVAFVGDVGIKASSQDVMRLISSENADMVFLLGDFDYVDDPNAWGEMLNRTLGEDFPIFGVVGNHDEKKWPEYQDFLKKEAHETTARCSGIIGEDYACLYKGFFFAGTKEGTLGSGNKSFMVNKLQKAHTPWKFCGWHKNNIMMQAGGKQSEIDISWYDLCRTQGAIIGTGHEHQYARTYEMENFERRLTSSTSSEITLSEGTTFAFVSGLGGQSIRNENFDLSKLPHWATVYTKNRGAQYGALFCTFNYEGIKNKAYCYFKNIDNEVVDEFTLISNL